MRCTCAASEPSVWICSCARNGKLPTSSPTSSTACGALEPPDRVIWGSDWPHIPDGGKNTGTLLNLLSDWAPDAGARERILVTNPARLFGFEDAHQR